MSDSNLLAALVDATAVEKEWSLFNDDKIEHGQAILDNLHATGYTVVRTDDVKRTKRQAHLAYLYLNVAEARNDSAKRAFGFRATPHFFLANAAGAARESMQGVVPADSLRAALDRLLVPSAAPR